MREVDQRIWVELEDEIEGNGGKCDKKGKERYFVEISG